MSDYNLSGLNTRDFEHLTQALAKKFIATGVSAFGDGRDGGREATFDGKMDYPAKTDSWEGYLVIQCKFRKRTTDTHADRQWAVAELKKELANWSHRIANGLRQPDYFLFVTNVVLSPVPDVGGHDQITNLLQEAEGTMSLKGSDVWAYDDLCAYIDGCSDIRNAYMNFITPGDVIAAMMQRLQPKNPDFNEIMHRFLQIELTQDHVAKLESAGQDPDTRIPLANVFVDLPITTNQEEAGTPPGFSHSLMPGFVQWMLERDFRVGEHEPSRTITTIEQSTTEATTFETIHAGRYVLVGGPGQGKSTLGQYLCQLYRASIVTSFDENRVDSQVRGIIDDLKQQRQSTNEDLPTARRFPIRIVLNQYASDLANQEGLSLLKYICRLISTTADDECDVDDLREWLAVYPWFIVLDGLDEVPASSNRREVLRQVTQFNIEAANLNADVVTLCTTRPQGYQDDFSPRYFTHLYLAPLDGEHALAYGQRLTDVRCGADKSRAQRLMRRLKTAITSDTTVRLMATPLQVTIMATLVERVGEPPRERYRLFQQYYETIYNRETGREGQFAAVLRDHKGDVDAIHRRSGLVLQKESEETGRTSAQLTDSQFTALLQARLAEIGVDPKTAQPMMEGLSDSSLHRLVFLVRPREGTIGFEIRSLQEFMAAEALMYGTDGAVVARLQELAPISHWRNVFLFAIGKCLVDKDYLLPNIVAICRTLNNDATAAHEATLWGSRLALDILEDGSTKSQPKYERLLVECALDLLHINDVHACRRLAFIYHEGLERLFNNAVIDRLGQLETRQRLGAWVIINTLADRDVRWAIDIEREGWPDDVEIQEHLIASIDRFPVRQEVSQQLSKVVPSVTPQGMVSRQIYYPDTEQIAGDRSGDGWLLPALVQMRGYRINRNELSPENIHVRIKGRGLGETIRLLVTALEPVAARWTYLANMPVGHADWLPFISAARFGQDPTAHALATELRILGSLDRSTHASNGWANFPWPMAACLAVCKTPTQFEAMARRVEAGELGSTDEWLAAERRWRNEGVGVRDFACTWNEDHPFTSDIAEVGFPFVCAAAISNPYANINWNVLYRLYEKVNNILHKAWIAAAIFDCQRPSRHRSTEQSLCIEPSELKKFIQDAQALRSITILDLGGAIVAPKHLNHTWLEFFKWIEAQQENKILITGNGEDLSEIVLQLVQSYTTSHEDNVDLLPLLCNLIQYNVQVELPVNILRMTWSNGGRYATDAAFLHLASGHWDIETSQQLIDLLVTSEDQGHRILSAIILSDRVSNSLERLLIYCLKQLNCQKSDSISAIETIMEVLVDTLMRQQSSLSDVRRWQTLELPEVVVQRDEFGTS
ncbi:MAG: hypothetical protein WD208_09485 [Dehalococcoidia bacterium]